MQGENYRPNDAALDGDGFFQIADALPAMVWSTDASLRLTAIAGRLTIASDPDPKRHLGETIQELLGTDDPETPPLAAHRRALQGDAVTYRYTWGNRIYESHVAPIHGTHGQITGCVGVGFDVTERIEGQTALAKARRDLQEEVDRRTAELREANEQLQREIAEHRQTVAALHESEARFRAFMDNNPAVTYMKDEQGRHVYGNKAWAALFGRPLEELMGTTAADVFPPETAAEFEENDTKVRETGDAIQTMESGIGPDGRRHRWQAVKFPIPSTSGEKLLGGFAIDVTEHRRAEEALRESEERFRSIYENSPLGIAMVSGDTQRILAANSPMCELLGYAEEELLQLTIPDVTHPDDMRDELVEIDDLRAGLVPKYSREKRYIRKDGSIRWVKLAAAKIDQGEGTPPLGVGIVEDITKRKLDEEARRRSETTLRALLNAIPESAFLLDRKGTIVLANEEMARRFGRSMDDLVGLSAATLVSGNTAARRMEKLNEVFRTGKSVRFVDRRLGRDIDQILSPVLDAEGNVELVAVLGMDITERLVAEQRLKRSEYEKSAILESMSEMFAFYDAELNIQWANRAAAESVNMSPEEMAGQKCYWIWHGRHMPCDDCPVIRAKQTGQPQHGEVETPDGRVWQLRSAPVYDAEGKLLGLAEFGQEVTERKRHQRELAESKRAAETANRAKSQFLANMSHEIRTPMTAILGYTDLLMNVDLPVVEQARHLQTIHRNAELLLALINDILDLTKIEAGKLSIERVPCSPVELVEEVVSLMRVRAQQKGIPIATDYGFPLPAHIVTDPVRLRQILLNLLGNAVKFTDEGWIRVSVRLIAAAGRSAVMEFAVADTGIGLSEAERSGVFDAFSQSDASTTRRFGGTGLGLAISKRLASMLGGTIEVESREGDGSTFTLSIDPGDLSKVPTISSRPETRRPREPDDASTGDRFRGRVLLAEDGQDNRELIGLVLGLAGVSVEYAENGRTACERALTSLEEGRPFDLILMDIQMPDVDGDEATRILRNSGWTGPIVALTAHAMAGDRERYLAAGCNGYLSKPVRRGALFDVLRQYVPIEAGDAVEPDRNTAGQEADLLVDSTLLDRKQRARLIRLFQEGLAERIAAVRAALDAQDAPRLGEAVHALAGSAAMFGFGDLAETARTLEGRLRKGAAINELNHELRMLISFCEGLLDT